MGYDAILFDLDGTLTDSAEGIVNSVRYALRSYGIEESDTAALMRFVGPPLAFSFREYYGFSEERAEEAVTRFREYFTEKGILENRVYDGVRELLVALKAEGKRLAVATSKPQPLAERVLHNFALYDLFDVVSGASYDERSMNKATVITAALDALGTPPSRVLMVGDRVYDVVGARECGVDACGVLYGCGTREEFVEAKYIAENVNDILHFACN